MEQYAVNFRQVRTFDQVLSTAFKFIRLNFKPLFSILVTIAGPLSVLGGFFYGLFYSSMTEFASVTPGADSGISGITLVAGIGLTVVFSLLSTLFVTTLTYAYIVLYVESGGMTPSRSAVWQRAKSAMPGFIGAALLVGLLVGFSFVLLIIPGIYVGIAVSTVFIMMMQERIGSNVAIGRCFTLVRGFWWQTFGILIVVSMLIGVINYVFAIPQGILLIISQTLAVDGEESTLVRLGLIIITALSFISLQLLYTLYHTAVAVQYYNLVERKEAAGLRERVESMGASPAEGVA